MDGLRGEGLGRSLARRGSFKTSQSGLSWPRLATKITGSLTSPEAVQEAAMPFGRTTDQERGARTAMGKSLFGFVVTVAFIEAVSDRYHSAMDLACAAMSGHQWLTFDRSQSS